MTAQDQLELDVVDAIISEPGEGAHTDHAATARAIKSAVVAAMGRIRQRGPQSLLAHRYARLRSIGRYQETEAGPRARPAPPSLRRRLGRLLHLPGVRAPRWSEIWPGDEDREEEETE